MTPGAPLTVGIDVGTSAVKALAADDDGRPVAQVRIPHGYRTPTPMRLEHDAQRAWRDGPRAAYDAIADAVGRSRIRGVSVSAMVPSLTAVDGAGRPLLPGVLYGDERGRDPADASPGSTSGSTSRSTSLDPPEYGALRNLAQWAAARVPGAAGLWPAQAVANHELAGAAVLDTSTAVTAVPLFDFVGWDAATLDAIGVRMEQLPRLVPTGLPCGIVDGDGPVLASGCIDALAEQLVAGADNDGDVLVMLGTTLLVWVVADVDVRVPGYLTVPHTTAGKFLVGGPSDAGGLFCDWALGLLRPGEPSEVAPVGVPVWTPHPRGVRAPGFDPAPRAVLADLDLTHGVGAVRRAVYEASAFTIRHVVETAGAHGVAARRVVATGGGARADEWIRAVADATELPVECVGVPEGAALGSAWLARIAAGLEAPEAMADARRWASSSGTVDPDPMWVPAVADRYARFLELSPVRPPAGDRSPRPDVPG